MADSAERPPGGAEDRTWDDLEQGFFASAPPDVPEPPPEPARFDDLFPPAPPRPDRLAAVRRTVAAAAATTRVSTRRAVVAAANVTRASTTRAVAAAAKVTRASTSRAVAHARRHALPALARARRAAAGRFAATGRFRAVLWSWRPDRRSLAIALTIAVVVGLSGGVIAARGATPPARVLAVAPPAAAAPVGVSAPRAAVTQPTAAAPPTAAIQSPVPPAAAAVTPATAAASDAVNEPAVQRPTLAKHPRPRQPDSARRHSSRNDVMMPTFMSSAPRPPSSGRQ